MILDIETDGLLDNCTTVHCAVLRREDTGLAQQFRPTELGDLLKQIDKCPVLIGHNLQGFDLPVLEKLYGYKYDGFIIDTLVLSRLVWPDLRDSDFGLVNKGRLPAQLVGRHSLEAWGYRLGFLKGDFNKTADWKEYSEEMMEYCTRDTDVTLRLFNHISEQQIDPESSKLEHQFSLCIDRMMRNGMGFDMAAAQALMVKLLVERGEIDSKLVAAFPPFTEKYITPKKKVEKTKTVAFNPQSRAHISKALQLKYGWQPKVFTETGEPQMDEAVMSKLEYPEAPLIARRLTLAKRLGQLAEGTQNWIGAVKPDGRIHGFVCHNGAVTGRCTHSNPNMAQIPKDADYRALFVPASGNVLVGCDASGLELRCFAHYLAAYDGGEYGKEVVSGDIHTKNQKAAGLATRNQAKTFIYGLLYGAGDSKIGEIVGGSDRDGRELRERFMSAIPAYRSLIQTLKVTLKSRKWLKGIDGRKLYVRHEHAALNTLLQSAGAIAMKKATVLACSAVQDKADLVAHIHDEMQFECRPEHAELVGKAASVSIAEAGSSLGFRCPLAGEWRVGKSWADTH